MKRQMKEKSKNAISIIGGADGPTSIFIAGHSKKQPLKIRIKNSIYRYKRKKVEKTIVDVYKRQIPWRDPKSPLQQQRLFRHSLP